MFDPKKGVVEWTNKYFIGDVVESSSNEGRLQVFAAKANNVSAIYIINTNSNYTSFTFGNFAGINDTNYVLVRRIFLLF